jgi:hypothetical protein
VLIFGNLVFFLFGFGALFIFLGLVILTKRRLGNYVRFRKPMAAAVTALVVGSVAVSAGVGITTFLWTEQSTTSMYYRVAVQINGTSPVILHLPAPGDPRFWNPLSVTIGTSSLRVNHDLTDTYAILHATGNVTFEVLSSFTPSPSNQSVSRVAQTGDSYRDWNASIDMSSADSGTTVAVTLEIRLDNYCYGLRYQFMAIIHVGSAQYPMEPPSIIVC